MDDQQREPEQEQTDVVEDLEVDQDDAKQITGGASPQLKPRGLDGIESQHNETLIEI